MKETENNEVTKIYGKYKINFYISTNIKVATLQNMNSYYYNIVKKEIIDLHENEYF